MNATSLFNSKNFAFAAVAAVSLVSVAHVAQAADVLNNKPSLTVLNSDLNLNTDAGVVSLYHRIHHAAEQVCGKADPRRLDQAVAAKACVDQAVAASVSAVGNQQLTRELVAHVKGSPKPVIVASLR
jgi:UrcA family protein